jgi:hypothetical protein
MLPLSELFVAFTFPGFMIFLSLLDILLVIVCFLYRPFELLFFRLAVFSVGEEDAVAFATDAAAAHTHGCFRAPVEM